MLTASVSVRVKDILVLNAQVKTLLKHGLVQFNECILLLKNGFLLTL